jgi:hypothetical protein
MFLIHAPTTSIFPFRLPPLRSANPLAVTLDSADQTSWADTANRQMLIETAQGQGRF